MPKNTVKTCCCQYICRESNQECGRPPTFMHLRTGKVFCWNHHATLSRVTGGWVNLQRLDAADVIARHKAKVGQAVHA